tara:strand:- start:312 stop:446 length:135 start_codon:yes stop_codon:yes gene_type:complete
MSVSCHISILYLSSMEETNMSWYTPKIAEVAVGLEINSYACAEV